jgi:thiol-disulfide isomerase/thioredoxin
MFRILLAATALLALSPIASAQRLEWEESPQYEVAVDGRADYAMRVFQPTAAKPFLLMLGGRLAPALLIDLSSKKVFALKSGDFRVEGDFLLSTSGVPKGSQAAVYTVSNGVTYFGIGGKKLSIRIRESLVGEVADGIILAHSPVYRIKRDAYKPKPKVIAKLKQVKKKTEFVVMFATWCPTCKAVIPAFMKILQATASPQFSARYIGIAMGGSEPRRELEKYGSEYPDIIVFQGGKERGRVTGAPSVPLEEALANLVK